MYESLDKLRAAYKMAKGVDIPPDKIRAAVIHFTDVTDDFIKNTLDDIVKQQVALGRNLTKVEIGVITDGLVTSMDLAQKLKDALKLAK